MAHLTDFCVCACAESAFGGRLSVVSYCCLVMESSLYTCTLYVHNNKMPCGNQVPQYIQVMRMHN